MVLLDITAPLKSALWRHLLPRKFNAEQAAFGFARWEGSLGHGILRCAEWLPISTRGFASRSKLHFELTDESRGAVIKKAHDLGASLVEFHSHDGDWPAAFSPSDLWGLAEFVPHIMWRLRGRPYAALVVTRESHDGLVWLDSSRKPVCLDGITVDGRVFESTRLSEVRLDDHE